MSIAAMIEQRRIVVGGTPLVGYVGADNTIDVIGRPDRLVVRLSRSTQRFIILAATLIGPVTTILLWLDPARFNPHAPTIVRLVLYIAVAGAWILLLYTLVTRPRFEIARDGDIVYFRRGRTASRVIRRGDIEGVTISEQTYVSGAFSRANRVLSAVMKSGEAVPLCASPDSDLIASLARNIATLTQTSVLDKANGQVTE